ncbi:hypothetical protein [Pseudoalteromonas luteoviolacea]|uniref:Uncharacterized protein n=1 Tax=Pseudoalteromonas luteoviolacea NCIMB 1942 TaxID=1365253 RepID=A0A166ZDP6_9GAMM|nr:hypothetical protein [Pseudoalteromonas luteoviolacea]KZN44205.1 hypothetical protein N482_17575 [Pseudoalteromonas luteoviolacea NCIMB 1942]KZX00980.1 hypothetical protein JL49_08330 [Pseudoalteromonas luteoviolacea]
MDKNEFEQLSSLWQSAEQKSVPHMDKLLKRHKRHSIVLKVNIAIEFIAILAVSCFFVISFIEKMPMIKLAWVGFATAWGITLFVLMNKSRLSSLKHLKSEQITTSLDAHMKLLENEIFRWSVSIKATWIFVIAMGVFVTSKCLFSICSAEDGLHLGASFLVLCSAQIFFIMKNRTAKSILHKIKQ